MRAILGKGGATNRNHVGSTLRLTASETTPLESPRAIGCRAAVIGFDKSAAEVQNGSKC